MPNPLDTGSDVSGSDDTGLGFADHVPSRTEEEQDCWSTLSSAPSDISLDSAALASDIGDSPSVHNTFYLNSDSHYAQSEPTYPSYARDEVLARLADGSLQSLGYRGKPLSYAEAMAERRRGRLGVAESAAAVLPSQRDQPEIKQKPDTYSLMRVYQNYGSADSACISTASLAYPSSSDELAKRKSAMSHSVADSGAGILCDGVKTPPSLHTISKSGLTDVSSRISSWDVCDSPLQPRSSLATRPVSLGVPLTSAALKDAQVPHPLQSVLSPSGSSVASFILSPAGQNSAVSNLVGRAENGGEAVRTVHDSAFESAQIDASANASRSIVDASASAAGTSHIDTAAASMAQTEMSRAFTVNSGDEAVSASLFGSSWEAKGTHEQLSSTQIVPQVSQDDATVVAVPSHPEENGIIDSGEPGAVEHNTSATHPDSNKNLRFVWRNPMKLLKGIIAMMLGSNLLTMAILCFSAHYLSKTANKAMLSVEYGYNEVHHGESVTVSIEDIGGEGVRPDVYEDLPPTDDDLHFMEEYPPMLMLVNYDGPTTSAETIAAVIIPANIDTLESAAITGSEECSSVDMHIVIPIGLAVLFLYLIRCLFRLARQKPGIEVTPAQTSGVRKGKPVIRTPQAKKTLPTATVELRPVVQRATVAQQTPGLRSPRKHDSPISAEILAAARRIATPAKADSDASCASQAIKSESEDIVPRRNAKVQRSSPNPVQKKIAFASLLGGPSAGSPLRKACMTAPADADLLNITPSKRSRRRSSTPNVTERVLRSASSSPVVKTEPDQPREPWTPAASVEPESGSSDTDRPRTAAKRKTTRKPTTKSDQVYEGEDDVDLVGSRASAAVDKRATVPPTQPSDTGSIATIATSDVPSAHDRFASDGSSTASEYSFGSSETPKVHSDAFHLVFTHSSSGLEHVSQLYDSETGKMHPKSPADFAKYGWTSFNKCFAKRDRCVELVYRYLSNVNEATTGDNWMRYNPYYAINAFKRQRDVHILLQKSVHGVSRDRKVSETG